MSAVVETRSGKLRGAISDGVAVFKGVRFAQPPFGANRLRPPQPVAAWTGVRDALEYGPKSPQGPYPPGVAEAMAELVGSGEDCLTLNIWTPAADAARRPVMVWIPGGMFEYHATGAAAYYDGSRFPRDGVVCVTISYRVGAEGFLYLPGETANLGLLDQIAALEWVRDNIDAFGGDSGNVTVFGESAGAMSVAVLMAMPRAKGLFRRAIMQSGAGPVVNSADTAERMARKLAEALGAPPTREAIAALSPDRALEAQMQLRMEMMTRPDPAVWGEVALTGLPWAPTIDGELLPARPIETIRAGAATDVDLLIGSNTQETRLFLLMDSAIDRVDDRQLASMAAAFGLSAEGLAAYRAMLPGASAGDVLSELQTDWYWRIPSLRLADAHAAAATAATYMYEFAWASPQEGGRLGAAHALEIPFVFDTLGLGTEPLLGSGPPQSLADAMHSAWVRFAATGDCGWPRYDHVRRQTMRFDITPRIVDDPMAARLAIWEHSAGPGASAPAWTLFD